MQLLLTSCILVVVRMCSADVTESTLSDVTEYVVLDVTESIPPDVNQSYQLNPPPVENNSPPPCQIYLLDPEFYELLPNRSVLLLDSGRTLDPGFYAIQNGTLHVCVALPPNPVVLVYITFANLVLSMICLFLHLVAFCLVPDLRNLPGWDLAALCACLLVSYALIFAMGFYEGMKNGGGCVAAASFAYFFLFSSFLWMSVQSSTVFASLRQAIKGLRGSGTQFKRRKFGLHCLCAFGVALLFTASAVVVDSIDSVPDEWRPMFRTSCWFNQRRPFLIFFAVPVSLLTCLNFGLFAASAWTVHANKRKRDQDAHQAGQQQTRYMLYFRLSAIMGVTWISFIVAYATGNYWMFVVVILLNTLQGFYIFLGFTCSKKVKKHFREEILGGILDRVSRPRSSSAPCTATTPT